MLARLLSHQAEGPQSFPLSFAQERLWFLDRLSPANPAYNIPGAFRLTGPLDKGALEAALNDVVARHHTLRTVFGQNGGKPVQTVLPTLAVPLWLATIDGNTAEDRQQMVARLIDAELCRPFDLSQGPLLRASLFPLGPADHVLLVVIHHIAADGWSLGLFNRDLEHAYAARKAGFPSTLAPLTTTYADYAAWQRTALTGERQEHLLRFWRERMADLPALDLPLDRPRPPLQSYRGGAVDIALDGTLVAAAERLARDLDTTPYCVLLAAFELMLARLSGQQDFAVGSPVANRGHPESETQIGFFVNTLALRSSIGGARVFRDLVQRITAATRAAHAHQDIPFEQLVERFDQVTGFGRRSAIEYG